MATAAEAATLVVLNASYSPNHNVTICAFRLTLLLEEFKRLFGIELEVVRWRFGYSFLERAVIAKTTQLQLELENPEEIFGISGVAVVLFDCSNHLDLSFIIEFLFYRGKVYMSVFIHNVWEI